MAMARIAIGSTDGVNIDTFFGKTEFFYIYEIQEGCMFFMVEKRDVRKAGDSVYQERGETIGTMLPDVQAVLAKHIGSYAVESLRAKGIAAVSIRCSVESAVRSYARHGKLFAFFVKAKNTGLINAPWREDCPLRALKNAVRSNKLPNKLRSCTEPCS
jgi:predicted Fe-Mo cluster-binding NifX family protein